MRILLDTNILARAAGGPPGPAHALFLLVTQHMHTLILSPFLLAELGRVLRYARLRPVHGMSDDEIDRFVADLILIADVVETPQNAASISADPADDSIIAAAAVGNAEVLCTLDRHLHAEGVQDHCLQRGIAVLTDLELLSRLRTPIA